MTAIDATQRTLTEIQAPVREQLDQVSGEMARIISQDLPFLDQISAHLMAMRGKLFRPTIVLLSSQTAGRADTRATTLAATVELIHLATLVHDDAIDHSVLRRGMPTLNSLFSHQISVIMGDFLYSTTLSELVNIGDIEVLRALTRASTDMTLGEMRQLSVSDSLSFSEDDYYALIKAKTASLMAAAAEIGALCGAPAHRSNLLEFGEALGMVFQISDDLIDYTEAQETTGKPTGLDLKEHKVTLPLIAAMRTMPASHRSRVDALFACKEPTDAMVSDVVSIVAKNGGLDYARTKGEYFAKRARIALQPLPDTVARRSLMDSITYVMERHS
ncbi:MAG: polyprenyl synthetase family protein [Gemmatimonadaceae bacterium]|nr:polyprenyl synthetase family protein [Gemmatimonadaceae bacterium]